MVTNSDHLDELDCFSSMDPASFYGVSPSVSRQAASMPRYPIQLELGGSRNASHSEGDLGCSERDKTPRFSEGCSANLRRSARERKPRVLSGMSPLTAPVGAAPRKRTLSVSALQNGASAAQGFAKKQRMDEKKAVCFCSSVDLPLLIVGYLANSRIE